VWISVACCGHGKKLGRIAGLRDWSSFKWGGLFVKGSKWVWKGQEMSKIFWRKGFILYGLHHLPFFFFSFHSFLNLTWFKALLSLSFSSFS
jgi:hypothetical protein